MTEQGLRERKKQATRAALIEAARRLGAELGPDNVRMEDIAAAAGVSARTVSNYFASKAEIILAVGAGRAAQFAAALLARPPAEPIWAALREVSIAQFAGATDITRANVAASAAAPDLHRAVEPVVAAAIAQRTGTDPERDLYPRLVAGALIAATRVAVGFWLTSDDPAPSLADLVGAAVQQVAAGLPDPRGGDVR
ncbi:TetR family transcriptional regulator [Asanoa ferruginea]|uniref:TetR family transcriptional regulator n=1 Tax=Asanoa ferruginea TaxID=53367 RepID=A0A3D9ZVI1_9ACTN|nr:TetR family transcriptional regulator [Asanoa ferruginea]REG01198.1 TetR family transcriptional regulator [Asanoa ferruginea]